MTKYEPVVRYCSDDGTTTGAKNANLEFATADEWYVEAAAGETLVFKRIMISYEDTSGMQANEYGNLGSALSNGIEMKVYDDSGNVKSDLTDGVPIKTNAQWANLAGPDTDVKAWGASPTDQLFIVRFTFSKFSDGIKLYPGWKYVVHLNDDVRGLITHYFILQGQ